MNGKTTIPYNISFGNDSQRANEMIFTSDKLKNSINVSLTEDSKVAGTYTDTLTFNISSQKQQYNLKIRGYLEDSEKENIGEIANIEVSGINGTTSNSLQYTNVDSTTKYKITVNNDSSKYVLSAVKNDGKIGDSTGFTWDENSNTITGIVAGDYATNNTIYVDLYFVPKTYTLTFDANQGTFKDGGTTKTYEVAYGKSLDKIGTDELNLNKRDSFYFGGWYTTTTEKGNPLISSFKMPSNDLTLYAGWSKGVKVGLNGLLEGETVLRDTLAGLGKADFIITKDDSKSEKML